MFNKLSNKSIAVFMAFISIFSLIPPSVIAQQNPSMPGNSLPDEIKGFNRSVFEGHFSRADRETNPERWLFEARLGITQAIYAWELVAGNLYENPMLFEESKKKIEKWSSDELEARFSKWLTGRFFGSAAEKAFMDYSAMFGETQKNYSWHLDDDGNIIFDDKTGDPLVLRPDDDREFSGDLLIWRDEADNLVKTNISSFDNILTGLYTELLAYIPMELRETMSAVIMETGGNFSAAIRQEFENIALREERIFTSRRTRDIWSLRRQNEDEAAKVFTEKLIAEIEESCARGIEELKVKIEEASAGTGDLAILGEEWLRLYKEQFDRGLKAWEEAEERFFIRRIEWEQESFRLFSQGEETWLAAFSKFEEERQRWELNAKELFESGEEMFKNLSEEFKRNIAEAKQEFELNKAMRTGEGTERVKALIDMYLVCASAAISAMENLQFWHSQYKSSNKKNPEDPDFYAWLLQEQSRTNNSSLQEIRKSYELYVSYKEKALEARSRILENYTELFGTGALKDILSPDASSEDFCLDEYQVSLIKAKALVLYWERKTEIAEAVLAYANELSAGRMTEAEGVRAWEDAKAAYYESLANYETELSKLNVIGEDIQKQQEILRVLAAQMLQEEEKLGKLNAEYTALVSSSIVNREDFYLLNLNTIYDSLVEEYKLFQNKGGDAVYSGIIEYGINWNIAERREAAESILDALINGYSDQIISLAELEERVIDGIVSQTDLKIRLAGIDLFADNSSSQLRPLDSAYSGADWYSKAKGLELSLEEKAALYGRNLGEQLTEDYRNSSAVLLEKRLELELNSLKNILNTDPLSGGFDYIPAEFCLVNREDIPIIYEVLLKLKERTVLGKIFWTENDEENEIINYFISGGSFFAGSEHYLLEYYNEYCFCLGLLELYNDYAAVNSFSQDEYWNGTINSLAELFSSYGINQSNGFIPDVQSICASILKKTGNFIQNVSQFLMEFDKCFYVIPQWLNFEINSWKNALIEYAASYAYYTGIWPENFSQLMSLMQAETELRYNELYQYTDSLVYVDTDEAEKLNEAFAKISDDFAVLFYCGQIKEVWDAINNDAVIAGNEKHWRQFLIDDYLTNDDSSLTAAFSRKEGVFLDAQFNMQYYTNRINDSFAGFSQNYSGYPTGNTMFNYGLYSYEAADIASRYNLLSVYFNEISNAGMAYEFSKIKPNDLKAQLELSYQALKTQEEIFSALRNNYFLEAEKFYNTGLLYDEQYSVMKKQHDNADQKRFEYEKQDAIQRWASTAYLNTDHIDLENSKIKLARAETVLAVLSDLYDGENHRSYDNPEYNRLYSEYEESFSRKIKTLEAVESVLTSIAQEKINNEKIFSEYQNTINQLGYVDQNYSGYVSPAFKSQWTVKDIITVKDGRLAFSTGYSMTLTGIDASKAQALDSFFNSTVPLNGERHEISQFEASLIELSQRMTGYLSSAEKYKQWSLARDYLITSLINANESLLFLDSFYSGLGLLKSGESLGSLYVKDGVLKKVEVLSSIFTTNIVTDKFYSKLGIYPVHLYPDAYFREAWESLSAAEKADLEYYVILTLTGSGNDYFAGFSQMYTLELYEYAYNYVNDKYQHAVGKSDDWFDFYQGWAFNGMKDINYNTLVRIDAVLSRTKSYTEKWTLGLQSNLLSIQNYAFSYIDSCNKIDDLEGKKSGGLSVEWSDISRSLLRTGTFSETDLAELKKHWEKMQAENRSAFSNVPDALKSMLEWAKDKESKNKAALEAQWQNDLQNQIINDTYFQTAMEAYIDGDINIETLKTAAENAYGKTAAAWKNHFDNMQTAMLRDLSLYLNINFDFYYEFSELGDDIVSLAAKTYENRFNAELETREFEWNLILKDLSEKYDEWLESAGRIFENGRTDWNASIEKMEEAYKQWKINFQNEYSRTSSEWAQAYLAGLEDKEKWLAQAASAANQASFESFILLVGTEGERLSRFIDTREPYGIRNAVPEVQTLMAELLQSSGIVGMSGAFGSLNNMTAAAPLVRQGTGGFSIWDAALTKTAAADLAKKTNAELAERESRKLVFGVRLAAEEAVNNLKANVDLANKNFRESMDNTFVLNGTWRISGNEYVKDIIKGSTLFTPVISQTATVMGYENFIMKPVQLRTNLDENSLAGLDTVVMRLLVENIYIEIGEIAAEIFGIGSEPKIIKKSNAENREQYPGQFGAHIGYTPAEKPFNEMGDSKDSMFYDKGSGELGRLLTEYIYWSVIDSKGSAELALAPWDKRIWNDENFFISAPTLRSIGQIAGTVAAAVVTGGAGVPGILLSAGIGTASNVVFGTFDVAFGYKTLDETAFDIGKSFLVNAAGGMTSALFGGFGGVDNILGNGITKTAVSSANNAAGKAVTQVLMSGLQSASTGLVTSAISGITYSRDGSFGYSGDIFNAGMKGMLSSTASSVVTSTLGIVNSGVSAEKLKGLNSGNINNLSVLNGLIGSIVGEGIDLAIGNDFTLNVLNLSLLTGGTYKSGLLELNIGRDGVKMNVGTGGANISYDNLKTAFSGAQVWGINTRINRYVKNPENDFDSAVALRAQYGYGEDPQKDQLREILKGLAKITTSEFGDFSAETAIVNGQRVINFSGYQSGMSPENQMLLAIVLGHEAYRDGIVTNENYLETRTAAFAHTEMALRMVMDGQQLSFSENLIMDIIAYSMGENFFNAYVDSFYDSSADYWKLTREGNLEYDGFATLRDENGNILRSFREMGLSNDNAIEGALLWLLNINPNDTENVNLVRQMMEDAGLLHSFDPNPNNWFWKGEHTVLLEINGSTPLWQSMNLTDVNMGKTIDIYSIGELFTSTGASGINTNTSIERIYGSAIGFLNYADVGNNTTIANIMLSNFYDPSKLAMIHENQIWLNNALINGIDIDGMMKGNARKTGDFGKLFVDLSINNGIEKYFSEAHTGLDYAGGDAVYSPGGNWELIKTDGHKAYFQLYGSDLMMRIQHLDGNTIAALTANTIFNSTSKLVDFPASNTGASTGPHIHIDMTMRLPYDGGSNTPINGYYTKQFVKPETLQPGWRLEYGYLARDINYNVVRSGNSNRYW